VDLSGTAIAKAMATLTAMTTDGGTTARGCGGLPPPPAAHQRADQRREVASMDTVKELDG
jgi:hypothetical protein